MNYDCESFNFEGYSMIGLNLNYIAYENVKSTIRFSIVSTLFDFKVLYGEIPIQNIQ